MTLGETIHAARENKGQSLRALAVELKLSAPFLSDVEHGRRRPLASRLEEFERVLELEPGTLAGLPSYSYELPPDVQAFAKAYPGVLEYIERKISLSARGSRCSCNNCLVLR